MLQHLPMTLLALAGTTCFAHAQVTISEACPSNIDLILDDDGSSSDWIELCNDSANDVSLDGWHLTDDEDELFKWRLPVVTLAPFERLLLWASGEGADPQPAVRFSPHVTQGSGGGGMGSLALLSLDGADLFRDCPS